MMFENHEIYLCDDGTMDTVISIDGEEHRFDGEYASQFRDTEGNMTENGLKELAEEILDDIL